MQGYTHDGRSRNLSSQKKNGKEGNASTAYTPTQSVARMSTNDRRSAHEPAKQARTTLSSCTDERL